MGREIFLHAVADQMISEERLTTIKTAFVALLTSVQLLVRHAVAGMRLTLKDSEQYSTN